MVEVAKYRVGGGAPLLWVCGPCVIEGRDFTLGVARRLREVADELGPTRPSSRRAVALEPRCPPCPSRPWQNSSAPAAQWNCAPADHG